MQDFVHQPYPLLLPRVLSWSPKPETQETVVIYVARTYEKEPYS